MLAEYFSKITGYNNKNNHYKNKIPISLLSSQWFSLTWIRNIYESVRFHESNSANMSCWFVYI